MSTNTRQRISIVMLLCCMLMSLAPCSLGALTTHEIKMFEQLRLKWSAESDSLLEQRSSVPATDPRYTELTKQIVRAQYWKNYYHEAKIDKSSWWNIITNTVVWSVQDLGEIATIMWETSEGLIEKAFTGNWTALLQDAVDSLMRQKLRTMIRSTFDGNTFQNIEDYIYTQMIAPKMETSAIEASAQQAFNKAKDSLKDAYVQEVKRQASTLPKQQLEAYGETIANRVGGAIDAAEFSMEMVQKYVLWDQAQGAIEAMLSHIKQIRDREHCSVIKAFDIYLGKESLTTRSVNEAGPRAEPNNAPETVKTVPAPEAAPSKDESFAPAQATQSAYIAATDTQKMHDLLWSTTPSTFEDIMARHTNSEFNKSKWYNNDIYQAPPPAGSTHLGVTVTVYYSREGTIDSILVKYDDSFRGTLFSYKTDYIFSSRISGTNTYERSPNGHTLEEIFGEKNYTYVKKQWTPEGKLKRFDVIQQYQTILHYAWDAQGNVIQSEDNRPLVDGKRQPLPWE